MNISVKQKLDIDSMYSDIILLVKRNSIINQKWLEFYIWPFVTFWRPIYTQNVLLHEVTFGHIM